MENMAVINKDYWTDKKVLVTGHTGFKGGWLCLWLKQLGSIVTGYALPPEKENDLYYAANVAGVLQKSVYGDVRDLELLKKHVTEAQPEVVFHLAAQPIVRKSYKDPLETFSTNVMGTANLLQVCRELTCLKAIVVVTTDKCYQNQEWHWGYRETDHLGGYDPYSSSKACAELVTAAYRKSYFQRSGGNDSATGVATARAGNVIGGGDWSSDRLIPDCFRAAQQASSIQIRHPMATRPWQHVLEPLRGYLMLAERLAADAKHFSEAFNFGPRDEDVVSVQAILEKINQRLPNPLNWAADKNEHPPETNLLKLDISKANASLGWQPKLNLDKALDLTVDWYDAVSKGKDVAALTNAQIAEYQRYSNLINGRSHV
jgi:CDP-glucose 4,6-dehydratase